MRLHEFQGKELFQRHGIAVPGGRVARSSAEAEQIAGELYTRAGSLRPEHRVPGVGGEDLHRRHCHEPDGQTPGPDAGDGSRVTGDVPQDP